jgi:hypothetical protein
MTPEQEKCLRDAEMFRRRAIECEDMAAKATNSGSRKDYLRQAGEYRSDARNCDELARDRGY